VGQLPNKRSRAHKHESSVNVSVLEVDRVQNQLTAVAGFDRDERILPHSLAMRKIACIRYS
jgi:hypothetical protein